MINTTNNQVVMSDEYAISLDVTAQGDGNSNELPINKTINKDSSVAELFPPACRELGLG